MKLTIKFHSASKLPAKKAEVYYDQIRTRLEEWEEGKVTGIPAVNGNFANGLFYALAEIYNGGFEQLMQNFAMQYTEISLRLINGLKKPLTDFPALESFVKLIEEAKEIGIPEESEDDDESEAAEDLDALDTKVYSLSNEIEKELLAFLS